MALEARDARESKASEAAHKSLAHASETRTTVAFLSTEEMRSKPEAALWRR